MQKSGDDGLKTDQRIWGSDRIGSNIPSDDENDDDDDDDDDKDDHGDDDHGIY